MYSLESENIFSESSLNLDCIKSIDCHHKFLTKETVYNILSFNEKTLKNNSITINIYFEKNVGNFLSGKSDFSAIELADKFNIISLKGVSKVESDFCLINNSFLVIEDHDSSLGYDTKSTITFSGDKENYMNINMINESIHEHSEDQILNVESFVDNYINSIHISLPSLSSNTISTSKQNPIIDSNSIPQLSSLDDATHNIVDVLTRSGNTGVSFDKLGLYLTTPGKKDGAYKKYGENHSKFAELIDLVLITDSSPRTIYLTKLGEAFYSLKDDDKNKILVFQMLRMDIIKDIISNSIYEDFNISAYLNNYVGKSTATRRTSSIKSILRFLDSNNISLPDQLLKAL